MADPFVRGERFSGGTGIGGSPKMKQSAKLNYYYIRDYEMNMYP